MLFRPFAPLQPSCVFFVGPPEARLNQVDLAFRCFDAGPGFFLKSVEYIYAASQPHGVDSAKCVTAMAKRLI
jgi:hypothetical protein